MVNVCINIAYLCVILYIEYAMKRNKWMKKIFLRHKNLHIANDTCYYVND